MERISMARGRRALTALAALALLAGCKAGPDFKPPESPKVAGYLSPNESLLRGGGAVDHPQTVSPGDKINGEWWALFSSPDLDRLVRQAVANNPTIAAAQATLLQARQLAVATGAANLPQASLNASLTRQHFNFETTGRILPATEFDLYSVGGGVSYAIDPAGGIARQVEQQGAAAEAQGYEVDAAYLSITGQVVMQALTVASLRAQEQAVDDIVHDDEQNVALVEQAKSGGAATDVDLVQANSQLANDRTLLPPLDQQVSLAEHMLAILCGQAPADFTPARFDLTRLELPQKLPLSVPSELVHQRPDILAAEADAHAASAAIGVVDATRYPSISLVATLAQGALSPSTLFTMMTNGTSAGPSASLPIFTGGAIDAREKAAQAAYQADIANYQQVVLTSFRQVADTLTALSHDEDELAAQDHALSAAEDAVRLARLSYQSGNSGVLQVLDPERLYQQARIGHVRAEAQRFLDTAQLFVALGGGWWDWSDRPGGPNDKPPVVSGGLLDPVRAATGSN